MKVLFLSNYFNHHQKYLCDNIFELVNQKFWFVESKEMTNERIQLGWTNDNNPSYILNLHSNDNTMIKRKFEESDILVYGDFPYKILSSTKLKDKLVFCYFERPLKKGDSFWKYIPRKILWKHKFKKNYHLLCASAFTILDYSKYNLFKNKAYKWGYFPECKHYDINKLVKEKDKQQILWAGRFIEWKHPEYVVFLADKLKKEGYSFVINMIGTGDLQQNIKEMVVQYSLEEYIKFLGAMPPNLVRYNMEKSGIYLFTSDKQEGWGVVLNESMNSGCAIVASHAIGSVPYLIENGVNGLVYESENINSLYKNIKYLLDNPYEQSRLGEAAYNTIVNEWNAEVAAERLIKLSEHILNGAETQNLYETGPCSKAEIIDDDWIKYEKFF